MGNLNTTILKVEDRNIFETLNRFFQSLLDKKIVDALLVPQASPLEKGYTQTLVKDRAEIKSVNPFAPILLENSAKFVASLTAWEIGQKIGVVLRSCEIRTVIELAKFKQASFDNLLIIGVDCLGTLELSDYQGILASGKKMQHLADLKVEELGCRLRTACECCEYPVATNAHITLGIIGLDINKEILVQVTDDNLREQLGLEKAEIPFNREKSVSALIAMRKKRKAEVLDQLRTRFADLTKLLAEFSLCRKCYSCRIACPICYCKECVFLTQVFAHRPEQYLKWAARKGKIKLPYQTLLYHLTRLNHMVTSCVECGQCSSACPNGLPVFELFMKVGIEVRKMFGYVPGQSIADEPPVGAFKEVELESIESAEQAS